MPIKFKNLIFLLGHDRRSFIFAFIFFLCMGFLNYSQKNELIGRFDIITPHYQSSSDGFLIEQLDPIYLREKIKLEFHNTIIYPKQKKGHTNIYFYVVSQDKLEILEKGNQVLEFVQKLSRDFDPKNSFISNEYRILYERSYQLYNRSKNYLKDVKVVEDQFDAWKSKGAFHHYEYNPIERLNRIVKENVDDLEKKNQLFDRKIRSFLQENFIEASLLSDPSIKRHSIDNATIFSLSFIISTLVLIIIGLLQKASKVVKRK